MRNCPLPSKRQQPDSETPDKTAARGYATRPPLERMLRIHQAVAHGKSPNAVHLGRELEVSSKSIHRDIEFMRDRLGLPIEFDYTRGG